MADRQKVLGLVLLVGFMYGPRFELVDVHIVATVVAAAGGLSYILRGLPGRRIFWWAAGGLFPALGWTLAATQFRGLGTDYTLPYLLAQGIIYILAGYYVFSLYRRCYAERASEVLIKHLVASTAVNALVVLASWVSQGVRSFLYEHLALSIGRYWVELGHRGMDVSLGGGASGSLGLATVFLVALMVPSIRRRPTVWGLPMGLVALGAVGLGRSGLIVIVGGTALMAARAIRNGSVGRLVWKPRVARRIAVGAGGALVVGGSLAVLPWSGMGSGQVQHIKEVAYPWVTGQLNEEPGGATERFGSGELLESSVAGEIVREMYFLPDRPVDTVLGTGNAGRSPSAPYIPSDVGYVRVIFGAGLVGVVLLYGYLGYLGAVARKWGRSWEGSAVTICIAVTLAANFKELYIFSRGGGPLLALCLWGAAMRITSTQGGRWLKRGEVGVAPLRD